MRKLPAAPFGAAVLALGVRLLPWKLVFAGGAALFDQPDAYYHLRRATIILHTFPRIPGIDRYMAYPYGAECPWPPLYDLVVAAIAWIAGLGSPTAPVVEAVASLLPPLLAALTVFPLYFVTRRFAGTTAAAVAALLFVAFPHHTLYSIVGSGDHHSAEVLLLLLFLLGYMKAFEGRDPSTSLRAAAWSGLALGAAVLVWQGSILFAFLLAGGLCLWAAGFAFSGREGDAAEEVEAAFRPALIALSAACILASAGRLVAASETEQTRFDFGFFSWFQPFFVFLTVLCLALVQWSVSGRPGSRGTAHRRRPAIASLGIAATLGAAFLVPGFGGNIAGGIRFLLARHPWLEVIKEFQPTFEASMFRDPFSLGAAAFAALFLDFLVPPAVGAWVFLRKRRAGESTVAAALFFFWSALFCLLAFRERRWANAYAANMAIGIGWGAALLMERRRSIESARRTRGKLAVIVALPALLLAALPQALFLRELAWYPEGMIAPIHDESLAWIRDNTPPTRGLHDSREKPEYAVFAFWGYGHLVKYVAERPTVVDNFGDQLRGGGLADSLRVYLSRDENELVDLCARRGIRYLFLTDIAPFRSELFALVGADAGGRRAGGEKPAVPKEVSLSGPYGRMFYDEGYEPAPPGWPARFRLIYESRSPDGDPSAISGLESVKIYEFVPGARITGRARPGRNVTLSCRLRTRLGRVFRFRTTVAADARGTFTAVVPYATDGPNYTTVPLGGADVEAAYGSGRVDIREEDILKGNTVEVR